MDSPRLIKEQIEFYKFRVGSDILKISLITVGFLLLISITEETYQLGLVLVYAGLFLIFSIKIIVLLYRIRVLYSHYLQLIRQTIIREKVHN
jgi:hypothetical protein